MSQETQMIEMALDLQPITDGPPVSPAGLMRTAASNDEITMEAWKDIWPANVRKNHAARGPFKPNGVGQLFGKWKSRGAILVGSGPSLKKNVETLAKFKDMPIVSCLHNFHFLEDHGVKVDYYVTLDGGPVTIEEVHEGGKHDPEHYWELTKDRKLIAFIGSNPGLIEKWQGDIYWFHAPMPGSIGDKMLQEIESIEKFHTFFSTGGNVLGACLYAARGIMAANPIIFVGADFSFSYAKRFHGWDSKYDKSLGETLRVPDIYGNRVHTWQSYYNFKCWFDRAACHDPGIYINATEGGIFGAYQTGNIKQVLQYTLKHVYEAYERHENIRPLCEEPDREINAENPIKLLF